ncbi:MAG: hypothetical protein J0I87_02315, partial [Cellulomonas sp.]|nr:hypothetical protein [Cellulomonas sp.]
ARVGEPNDAWLSWTTAGSKANSSTSERITRRPYAAAVDRFVSAGEMPFRVVGILCCHGGMRDDLTTTTAAAVAGACRRLCCRR